MSENRKSPPDTEATPQPKRLIEVAFPLREVSAESREKRQISGIHMWWARRPPTACRAAIFAALVPDPDDVDCPTAFRALVEELVPAQYDAYDKDGPHPPLRRRLLGFVADLCKWENSNNQRLLAVARRLILEANGGTAPRVLDPFAGGGSIPLETRRLGCEVHASELNPVAVLILKCTVEYPQKYGQPDSRPVPDYIHEIDRREAEGKGQQRLTDGDGPWAAAYRRNPLATDVRHWGQWVLERAREKLAPYYPAGPDGRTPVAYFWARTVRCPNPACGAEMPLIRQYWLARKPKKRIALEPLVDTSRKTVRFQVREGNEVGGNPALATTERTGVRCLFCGAIASGEHIRSEGKSGRIGTTMTAVAVDGGRDGKLYREAKATDIEVFRAASDALASLSAPADGLPEIPDEPTPPYRITGGNIAVYGFDTFGKLFNARQLLALISFGRLVKQAYAGLRRSGLDEEYAAAVTTYLACVVDKLADFGSTLASWHVTNEQISHTFARQAYPMVWDCTETNPVGNSTGSWPSVFRDMLRALERCVEAESSREVRVSPSDAARLNQPDGSFSAVLTDPPYYDSVSYADLADFFYVWLKRNVGELYPHLFATPLTPKSTEIIEHRNRNGGGDRARQFYREGMAKAFAEMRRVLRPGGISWIVFAHTTTEAWETLVSAMLDEGFTVTASWPVHTEMASRVRAADTASLASSVFLVCRPRPPDAGVAYLHEVSEELRSRIRERLDYFWAQGIRGADFFVSAIGPALEVYSRHAEVRTTAGDRVTVKQFLELVRSEVIDYALSQVLGNGSLGAVDNETRFYVLWRWAYGALPLEAGEVITFVKPMGVELDEIIRDGIVSKKGSKITLKSATDRADDEDLGEPRAGIQAPIIDGIHRCLNLWRLNKRDELADYLSTLGEARVDLLKRCAQALSEVLREDDPERRDLHAMLSGGLEPSMRRML